MVILLARVLAVLTLALTPGAALLPGAASLTPWGARAGSGTAAPAGPRPPSDTAVGWPLWPRPEVVRGFEPPSTLWGPGHRGVDLLGHPGQPVHAARAGTISFTGRIEGAGIVVVDHGVTRTTYEPVTPRVHRGAAVTQGEVIGTLQAAPSHCWPRACLHWGLLRGQTYLDPLVLVGVRPVRLLPLTGPAG